MSTAGRGGEQTAEELLAAMLTEPEHLALLKWIRDHNSAHDDVVFAMVGVLGIFAWIYHKTLGAIELAQHGRAEMVSAIVLAEQALSDCVARQVAVLNDTHARINAMIGGHAGQLSFAASEVRHLNETLAKLTGDARATLQAYRRLADDGSGATPSNLFQQQARAAVDKRTAYLDGAIRTLIRDTGATTRRWLVASTATQLVVVAALLLLLRR